MNTCKAGKLIYRSCTIRHTIQKEIQNEKNELYNDQRASALTLCPNQVTVCSWQMSFCCISGCCRKLLESDFLVFMLKGMLYLTFHFVLVTLFVTTVIIYKLLTPNYFQTFTNPKSENVWTVWKTQIKRK